MIFFEKSLKDKFGETSAHRVLECLDELNLPFPEMEGEFLSATAGFLTFLDDYAVSVRLEFTEDHITKSERLDHPLILQPLGALYADDVTIEIMPGTRTTNSEDLSWEVQDILRDDNIDYWDHKSNNIGILPIKTVDFPDGVPVVIDRLAASTLPIEKRTKSDFETLEDKGFQDRLYGDLRKTFQRFVLKQTTAQKFWQECLQAKADYKIFPGWQYYEHRHQIHEICCEDKMNDGRVVINPKLSKLGKQGQALQAGEAYAKRLRQKPPHL